MTGETEIKKKIIDDFNHIAGLDEPEDNNSIYHNLLLKNLQGTEGTYLDIGCGKGTFTRLLAENAEHVTGIDISPGMILKAKELSGAFNNIEFITGDILQYPFDENSFDAVVSVAAMHHINMNELLPKVKRALKVNGVLVILDLYKASSFSEYFMALISLFYSRWLRLLNKKTYKDNCRAAEIWNRHTATDVYLNFRELNGIFDNHFDKYCLKRKLLWRYIFIWKKLKA